MTYGNKHVCSIAFAGLAACLSVALLPSLRADSWDKMTKLTVNEPVRVPSCCAPGHTVTLAPGEYVIKLIDSISDRHIVRIFDKDQKNVITTILAIPNYRLQPTGKTVFQYWEVPAGHDRALRAWFYPGDNYGQEFAYPKQTAAELAALVKAPVPAIEVETSVEDDLKTAPLVAVDETGRSTILDYSPPPKITAEVRQPVRLQPEPAPMPVMEAAAPEAATLPQTASRLPLVGLAGLVALGLYALSGFRSRRPNFSSN